MAAAALIFNTVVNASRRLMFSLCRNKDSDRSDVLVAVNSMLAQAWCVGAVHDWPSCNDGVCCHGVGCNMQ